MNKPKKDKSILIRVTEDEMEAIDMAVMLMGYDNRSHFVRQCLKMAINPVMFEMKKRGVKASEVIEQAHANKLEQSSVFDS